VGGDFDLSTELAKAVATRQGTVSGEAICQGWLCQTTIGQQHCHQILRYKLSADYVQDDPSAELAESEVMAGNGD
jgi:hypothetical protein